MITSNLAQVKINAGGVAPFGQSLPILHPELSPCADRGAFDQYGRPAPPDSIDTMTCPGLFTANTRIEVENSLRPFLSTKYYGLPMGVSGGGDTLFGNAASAGRLIDFTKEIPLDLASTTGGAGTKNINSDLAFAQAGQNRLGLVTPNATFAPQQYVRLGNNGYY
jgi:hypothetical protein